MMATSRINGESANVAVAVRVGTTVTVLALAIPAAYWEVVVGLFRSMGHR
jgi:hypothetical protein